MEGTGPAAGLDSSASSGQGASKEHSIQEAFVIPFAAIWQLSDKRKSLPSIEKRTSTSRAEVANTEYEVLLQKSSQIGFVMLQSAYTFLEAAAVLVVATYGTL